MTAEVYLLSAILGVLVGIVFIKGLIRILPALAVASCLALDAHALDEDCCEEIVAAIQIADSYNQYWLSYIQNDTNKLHNVESYLNYIMSYNMSMDYNISAAATNVASMYLQWTGSLNEINASLDDVNYKLIEIDTELDDQGLTLDSIDTVLSDSNYTLAEIRDLLQTQNSYIEESAPDPQEREPDQLEQPGDPKAAIVEGANGFTFDNNPLTNPDTLDSADKTGLIELDLDSLTAEEAPPQFAPSLAYTNHPGMSEVTWSMGSMSQSGWFSWLAPIVSIIFTGYLMYRILSWTVSMTMRLSAS